MFSFGVIHSIADVVFAAILRAKESLFWVKEIGNRKKKDKFESGTVDSINDRPQTKWNKLILKQLFLKVSLSLNFYQIIIFCFVLYKLFWINKIWFFFLFFKPLKNIVTTSSLKTETILVKR